MGYYIKKPYQLTDRYEEMAEAFVAMFDAPTEEEILHKAIDESVIEHGDVNTVIDLDKLKSILGFDDSIKHLGDVIGGMLDECDDSEL